MYKALERFVEWHKTHAPMLEEPKWESALCGVIEKAVATFTDDEQELLMELIKISERHSIVERMSDKLLLEIETNNRNNSGATLQ